MVFLSFIPAQFLANFDDRFDDWVYPDQCATGYKRLNIVYRNRYIIENTDFIIAYNRYQNKAYEFCKKAKNKGVKVIELYDGNE